MIHVVDLGTKQANALDALFSSKQTDVSTAGLARANCLGIDLQDKYKAVVENKGYQFQQADLSNTNIVSQLPKANGYLSWHFLEHLPSKEAANNIIAEILSKATDFVWFKLPSFEQSEINGEGVLRKLGLRFTWTHWRGHTCAWTLDDHLAALANYKERKFTTYSKPSGLIRTTDSPLVVPIDSPIDTLKYSKSLGAKPSVSFEDPIISEWTCIIKFGEVQPWTLNS